MPLLVPILSVKLGIYWGIIAGVSKTRPLMKFAVMFAENNNLLVFMYTLAMAIYSLDVLHAVI